MLVGHGGPGFGILFGVVWFLGVVLVAVVCIGLVVLLVRFLLVATRAAQLYIEQHGGAPTAGIPRRYATYGPTSAAHAPAAAPAPTPTHPAPTPDPAPEDVAPPAAPTPPSAPKRAPRARKSPGTPE